MCFVIGDKPAASKVMSWGPGLKLTARPSSTIDSPLSTVIRTSLAGWPLAEETSNTTVAIEASTLDSHCWQSGCIAAGHSGPPHWMSLAFASMRLPALIKRWAFAKADAHIFFESSLARPVGAQPRKIQSAAVHPLKQGRARIRDTRP